MSVVGTRRQTTVSEWVIGIVFAFLSAAAALVLLAPEPWRQAMEDRGRPLLPLDKAWVEIGHRNVTLGEFLRRPRRGHGLLAFRVEAGSLFWLTTRNERNENLNPIVCPDGRVFLLDWAQADGPPTASVWDGASWSPITVPNLAQYPRPLISGLTCAPDGRILFRTSSAIFDQEGNQLGPQALRLVVTSEGFYRLSSEPGTFPVGFARQPEGPWLPVGGGRGIETLAAASDTVLAWGENVGRVKGTSAIWREWPHGFKPTNVVPLQAGGYIAWNDKILYVARTFEEAPIDVEMPSPGRLTGILDGVDEPGVLWFLQGSRARRFRLR